MSSAQRRTIQSSHGLDVNGCVSSGIGLMISKALEENGAKVYIVGRRKEVLEKVAKEEAASYPSQTL